MSNAQIKSLNFAVIIAVSRKFLTSVVRTDTDSHAVYEDVCLL